MNIDIKPHTIVILIGPSGSGKTTFAKNVLVKQLEGLQPLANRDRVNVQYISSDDCRRELLGSSEAVGVPVDRFSPAYDVISPQAFDVLNARLRAAIEFPVNAEFVILDTKGTFAPMLTEWAKIARIANYNVLPIIFQPDVSEIFSNGCSTSIRRSVAVDVKKVNVDVRPLLSKLKAKPVTIKDLDKPVTITSEDHQQLVNLVVDNDHELLVIGDVHGCYDELLELLAKNGITVDADGKIVTNEHSKHVVLVGDYIDKGPQIAECINFVHANIDNKLFSVVVGNHENRVYRELFDNLTRLDNLREFFNTTDLLAENDGLKTKFAEAFQKSVPWVMNDFAVITHAPCSVKYLGKINPKALSAARYVNYELTKDNVVEVVDEITSGEIRFPIRHIFGHVPTSTPGERSKNRILVDGGCVDGGKLCSVAINYRRQVFTQTVSSKQPVTRELVRFRPENETDALIPPDVMAKARRFAADGVNFISGTMSPSPTDGKSLETVTTAVDYYRSIGVTEVVAQPKYMGSRCNVYLHRDPTESYATSRNGYLVRQVDLTQVFTNLSDRLFSMPRFADAEVILIDGELMPWSAIGQGLVNEFTRTGADARREVEFLKSTGFEQRLTAAKAELDATNFVAESKVIKKKELVKAYGGRYQRFSALAAADEYIPADERLQGLDVYDEQLRIYGSPGELEFEPFAILKVVKADGTEVVPAIDGSFTNTEMFEVLTGAPLPIYDLTKAEDVKTLEQYFQLLTGSLKMEGIVIKPNVVNDERVLPYMKVRNERYLTIIYGHDYRTSSKLAKLIDRKSIKRKLSASAGQWRLGRRMLQIPLAKVNADNVEYVKLIAKFLESESNATNIDPRL